MMSKHENFSVAKKLKQERERNNGMRDREQEKEIGREIQSEREK